MDGSTFHKKPLEGQMLDSQSTKLLTSEEFITDVLCELKLHNVTQIRLVDTMEDKRFAQAYQRLVERQKQFNLVLDFSLSTNPYHGDSGTLRETFYALRERGVVAINNPSFKTVDIKVDDEDAEYFLSKSVIPRQFMRDLIEEIFQTEENTDGTGRRTA